MRNLPAMNIALILMAGTFLGCGNPDHKASPESKGYGSGKSEQERYCTDNGWKYDAKSNSCVKQ